jgi:2-octaprenyl-6-methoxyphenol hydroxylase
VPEPREVDVVIAGGGPVGGALTLALAESALSVAWVGGDAEAADRPIALSHGSRLILERLGAWRGLPATPIETVHVSCEGFGRTLMRAADSGLPALGYVAAYSQIVRQLAACAAEALPGKVQRWEADAGGVSLRVSRGAGDAVLRARLLVLADGGANRGSEFRRDYRQQAIVADVAVERPRPGVAFERFTREGPLALLPHGERYALVWSARADTAEKLLALPDAGFLRALHDAVGGRLGEMRSAGPRSAFPLLLRKGPINPGPRVVAIGNAAQALHPVAGQGFNLGLRDAWELAQMLLDVRPEEIGAHAFIAEYARKRGFDRRSAIGVTDFFTRIFSNAFPPLAAARGAGLAVLDACRPARNFLARRMIFGARAFP